MKHPDAQEAPPPEEDEMEATPAWLTEEDHADALKILRARPVTPEEEAELTEMFGTPAKRQA